MQCCMTRLASPITPEPKALDQNSASMVTQSNQSQVLMSCRFYINQNEVWKIYGLPTASKNFEIIQIFETEQVNH